jgi:Leucine-rich repeat (LRR) protein
MVNQIIKTKLFYMFLISQTIFFNINSFLFDFSDHSLDPVCLNLSRKNFENTNDCWNTIQQVAIEKGIQLEDVTELCIQNTNLTELPHEIGQLTNLKRLDLPNNSLEILPEEITNLQELCYLNLTNNILNKVNFIKSR